MLSRQPGDRTLPTLITLLVLGLLLMTFDIRSAGEGVTGVLRSGTQTIVAPIQKGVAFAVNPAVDMIESLSNVASLRIRNLELQRELDETKAALVAVDDQLARLELYEQLYNLEATDADIGRTVAQVIGQPAGEGSLIIDKGTSDGVVVGQPVLDTSGYVAGSVSQVTPGTATIIPITVGPSGVAVAVGDQVGTVVPQIDTNEMRLELTDAEEPVLAGERVVTSSASVRFPSGYPVGEILVDAAPANSSLITTISPYIEPDTLRVVVVLAWPPDPVAAITEPTTTTTTIPGGDGSSTSSSSSSSPSSTTTAGDG